MTNKISKSEREKRAWDSRAKDVRAIFKKKMDPFEIKCFICKRICKVPNEEYFKIRSKGIYCKSCRKEYIK